MRFKFCSDGDCPLWVLAALNAVSSLPASLFQRLLDQVVDEQSVIYIGARCSTCDSVIHLMEDAIMDVLKDTNFSSRDECARMAAVIRWTLKSTWRSRCEGSQLTRDLLVFGVPRAHAAALADAADAGRATYEASAKENAFMVNRVTDASISEAPEGTVDAVTLKLHTDDVFTGETKESDIIISKLHIPVLLEELKKAYERIERVETE